MKYVYIIIILISAIFSLRAFRLKWPLAYRVFSVAIFTALAIEVFSRIWNDYVYDPKLMNTNYWFITPTLIPQYLLYFSTFYLVIKAPATRKLILILAVAYTLFALYNMLWGQGIQTINSHTHMVADFLILLFVYLFFEELRKRETPVKLSTNPMVWISLGLCVLHLLDIPIMFNVNNLSSQKMTTFLKAILNTHRFIIFLSYILFIKAFLCPTPQK